MENRRSQGIRQNPSRWSWWLERAPPEGYADNSSTAAPSVFSGFLSSPPWTFPYHLHLYSSIIDLPIGYGPLEVRGRLVNLSLSMISCWLLAFAPSQRTVFLSILHGLLHFPVILVDICFNAFFSWLFFWASACCLLLLLPVLLSSVRPWHLDLQTCSALPGRMPACCVKGSRELVPRREWQLYPPS